ncbi:SURF1 family protein [Nocardioides nanhaiensis]|uniref:SURF1-like protein n=1 Tax=Nocardioides nanhaiensis TaxID=1476871 RepID=A0ABP8WM10_9ACTN
MCTYSGGVRSFAFLLSRRWLLFALAVVLLAAGAWWLGQWQFDRLEDRQASNAVVRANEAKAPAAVDEVLAVGRPVSSQDEWRLVEATGTYAVDETIIVRYRTREGASGVDVVVPLVTEQGPALLVDRGWLATEAQGTTTPDDVPAPPSGEVTVTGWVRADGTGDSTAVSDLSTRAVSSVTIGDALDRDVYGGFADLQSESPEPAVSLEPVELPELDNGPHFFYGLQWWFFALLALVGFGYLAYDERKRGPSGQRPRREQKPRRPAKPPKQPSARKVRDAARREAVRAEIERQEQSSRR